MKIGIKLLALTLVQLGLGLSARLQAAAPVLSNITFAVETPRFAVHSDLGISNQIQCCTNLAASNWTPLTNLAVNQSPYWFEHVGAPPAPQRFYRVLAQTTNSTAPPNMVLIPAGTFVMGDTFNEGWPGERPAHTLYVSAFYMDQSEVTKALWDEVFQWATNHGYAFDVSIYWHGKAENHPAFGVNWYDCVKWCNARSEKEQRLPAYYTDPAQTMVYRSGKVHIQGAWVNWGAGYRLPTEAEWEKAARGGLNGNRFPWGDTITHSQANYYSTATYAYDISPTRELHPTFNDGTSPSTSPAAYFAPNSYGLYDMAGNVLEWCWDWMDFMWYINPGATQSDTRGPTGTATYRVYRGGSCQGDSLGSRCAFRAQATPGSASDHVGFRCVKSP